MMAGPGSEAWGVEAERIVTSGDGLCERSEHINKGGAGLWGVDGDAPPGLPVEMREHAVREIPCRHAKDAQEPLGVRMVE